MNLTERTGKIAYGIIFIILVPLLLFFWGWRTNGLVHLPVPLSSFSGILVSLFGFLIMLSGMIALMRFGKGLPMNAYPPAQFVSKGIYSVIPHPIYTGFCFFVAGVSIALQSPGGLWLVTPFVIMACTAIVYGFEKHDLEERFGRSIPQTYIALPANEERIPFHRERISVFILLFIPWVILYESVAAIGIPHDAIVGYLRFEYDLPVIEWTEIFYISTYLFVLAVPFFVRSSKLLRTFTIDGLIATAVIIFFFHTLPIIAPPREFIPTTFLGKLIDLERMYDTPAAAFPSFHVVWAFLAARVYARSFSSLKYFWWLWAAAISVSCMTTGMHSLVDVVAGIGATILIIRITTVWNALRQFSERIANSWKEWQFGNLRIINHGAYAGAGTMIGLFIAGILLGPSAIVSILIVAASSLVASALWAQFIEGSPSLLRPYGYYGGLFGGILGCFIAQFFGTNIWLLLAVFGTVGPIIQSFGRIRCLVQGCCHGHPSDEQIGIKYTHPRSRVVRLANLSGVALHPTPLYSILWNIVTGIILARLWSLGAAPTLMAGLYLILNGMGRFVEESFRGEPQTPILGKLRLYQAMSILSVFTGIIFSSIPTTVSLPPPEFHLNALYLGLTFGIFTWFALGVDFPNSNRRFARLV